MRFSQRNRPGLQFFGLRVLWQSVQFPKIMTTII